MTLTYHITEIADETNVKEDTLLEIYNSAPSAPSPSAPSPSAPSPCAHTEHSQTYMVLYFDYFENNTIKSLTKIIDYYGLPKKKMTKDEIVQSIVLFELDEDHQEVVNTRKRLWENIKELKDNHFFSKFILFEP